MERNLFSELTATELQEVDGGEWEWYYDLAIKALCPPLIGDFIAKDLRNAYEVGFAAGQAAQ